MSAAEIIVLIVWVLICISPALFWLVKAWLDTRPRRKADG